MILIIDNHDSFVHNIARYVRELGAECRVVLNDEVSAEAIATLVPARLIISPGPCTPDRAGISVDVVRRLRGACPVLGICLGHQCIAEAYGARVVRAAVPMHGKVSAIHHDGSGLFAGLPSPFRATRYHSLVVEEGSVPPEIRRMEGPFGDHFGHYSEAELFPVFNVKTVTRRRNPVYPGAVVGKPPQEDKWIGIAAGQIVGPLIRVINPSIREVCANDDAVFHNLLVVSMVERHPKEALKTALNLLGTGQLSLTKVTVLVRDDVDPKSFRAMLRELWHRFDPADRMLLLPIAPLDTLDYTSYELHVGSKLILDATGPAKTTEPPPTSINDPSSFDRRIGRHKVLDGGFVVLHVKENPRDVLANLVKWEGLGPVRFVVAVSEDVDLDDETSTVWGIFTRFDPARDMIFQRQEFIGAKPVYGGRIGIDATWKPGYPPPVEMPPEVVSLVERRWGEYFGG